MFTSFNVNFDLFLIIFRLFIGRLFIYLFISPYKTAVCNLMYLGSMYLSGKKNPANAITIWHNFLKLVIMVYFVSKPIYQNLVLLHPIKINYLCFILIYSWSQIGKYIYVFMPKCLFYLLYFKPVMFCVIMF